MSTQSIIRAIEVQAFAHSTEDPGKVRKALLELFPPELRDKVELQEEYLSGHYGNPIRKLVIKLEGPDAVRVLNYILERLDSADKSYLLASIEERVDKNGVFYFRLSKQDAYLGRLSIYEADDVIRVSVHVTGRRRRAIRFLEELLRSGG